MKKKDFALLEKDYEIKRLEGLIKKLEYRVSEKQAQIREQQAEIEALMDKAEILELMLEETQKYLPQVAEDRKGEYIAKGKAAAAVVFGGLDSWQARIKEEAPGFVCVPVNSGNFDVRILDKAQAIVIKYDLISHRQWYKIKDIVRKYKIKVVYVNNNLENMFAMVGELV